ncbi:MAG: type II toxin-antitoxin system death-on-curing family toxin [Coriobacteriia bacterium]|nr:type II toxin-antitoxin system death-on-curing family toxin [Coriobacteriia bacterium]
MRKQPRWVDRLVVDAVHLDLVREHGGMQGTRDEGALEAALTRPRQRWADGDDPDLATLAAAYAFGLARNHAYHDGYKRIAFVTMTVFLRLNGRKIDAAEEEVVAVMLELADGTLAEDALAEWIRSHSTAG